MSRRKSSMQPSPSGLQKKSRTFPFRKSEHTRFGQSDDDSPGFLASETHGETHPPLPPQPQSLPEEQSPVGPAQRPTTANGTATTIPEEAPSSDSVVPQPPEIQTSLPQVPPKTPQVDSEGYSTRPDTIDEITRAQREASMSVFFLSDFLRVFVDQINRADDHHFNLTIRKEKIQEDEEAAKQALNDVSSRLRVVSLCTSLLPTVSKWSIASSAISPFSRPWHLAWPQRCQKHRLCPKSRRARPATSFGCSIFECAFRASYTDSSFLSNTR